MTAALSKQGIDEWSQGAGHTDDRDDQCHDGQSDEQRHEPPDTLPEQGRYHSREGPEGDRNPRPARASSSGFRRHHATFLMTVMPNTNTSMSVCKKVMRASAGEATMGSPLSLNEVFSNAAS